jgi:hypothetical protein
MTDAEKQEIAEAIRLRRREHMKRFAEQCQATDDEIWGEEVRMVMSKYR